MSGRGGLMMWHAVMGSPLNWPEERRPLNDDEKIEVCEYESISAMRSYWKDLNQKGTRNHPCSCGSNRKVKKCHGVGFIE